MSSTDQRMTKLFVSAGNLVLPVKRAVPRRETCGQWFRDSSTINTSTFVARSVDVLPSSRSIHHEALRRSDDELSQRLEPSNCDGTRAQRAVLFFRLLFRALMRKRQTMVSQGTRVNTTAPSSHELNAPIWFCSVLR